MTASPAIRSSIGFLVALISTNLKAALAQRGAFWLQVSFMAANNLIFFCVWWLFFRRFDDVGGWRLADVTLMVGMVSAAFGLMVTIAGGTRNLAQVIAEGDLDVFLSQPKAVLPHVALSRSFPSGWGDLATGFVLIALSGLVAGWQIPLVLLLIGSGAIILATTSIMTHAAAFWLGPINALARMMLDFLVMFSVYPQTIYTGFMKILIFTIMPAGFIGFLPVEIIREFSVGKILIVTVGTATYTLLAVWIFALGLRRYASGSRFGVRI